MWWRTTEGSTGRLIQLCIGYFVFYVITGVAVKYFTGSAAAGFPGMKDLEFLVYSTAGGTLICLVVAVAAGWYRLRSNRRISWGPFTFPSEFLYIIPSGVCTAVVIPTTTLMYMLPGISVMVAMVIMRGSVIVISRLVDELQIRQGILKKRVYREENLAVVFAIGAVSVHLAMDQKKGGSLLQSTAAMAVLGSYLAAYLFRIYVMNYYKNTRPKGLEQDNKGFFAVEQIAASATMMMATVILFYSPQLFGWDGQGIRIFRGAIAEPRPMWGWAIVAGLFYGAVAFFSVFLFMFKGRTATFAGLVNRLTSLVAGTAATLIFWAAFGGKFPKTADWISLGFIVVAVGFLSLAERKRAAELAAGRG